MYVGDQAGGTSGKFGRRRQDAHHRCDARARRRSSARSTVRATASTGSAPAGREYVLHSNEGGSGGIAGQAAGGDTCKPYPRPTALGWGFEATRQ